MMGDKRNGTPDNCDGDGGQDMTAASSNIEFSDENAVAKQDTTAGKRRQQTGRPPALVVRLPGAVEHMAERRDRDRARWLGGTFDRPATPSERAFLAARGALSDPSARTALLTRVEVRGGVRRRTWPMLDGAV